MVYFYQKLGLPGWTSFVLKFRILIEKYVCMLSTLIYLLWLTCGLVSCQWCVWSDEKSAQRQKMWSGQAPSQICSFSYSSTSYSCCGCLSGSLPGDQLLTPNVMITTSISEKVRPSRQEAVLQRTTKHRLPTLNHIELQVKLYEVACRVYVDKRYLSLSSIGCSRNSLWYIRTTLH